VIHTRSGKDYYFGGGQMNLAFRFEQVSAEMAKRWRRLATPSA